VDDNVRGFNENGVQAFAHNLPRGRRRLGGGRRCVKAHEGDGDGAASNTMERIAAHVAAARFAAARPRVRRMHAVRAATGARP
jgi:hypothetical protein